MHVTTNVCILPGMLHCLYSIIYMIVKWTLRTYKKSHVTHFLIDLFFLRVLSLVPILFHKPTRISQIFTKWAMWSDMALWKITLAVDWNKE